MKSDGAVEELFNTAMEDIQTGRYTKEAREKLLEFIKYRPESAEPYLHLARIYSEEMVLSKDGKKVPEPAGRNYYEKAIKLYFKESWKTAGQVFGEYFKKYRQPLDDLRLHFEASKALIKLKDYDTAERALEVLTKMTTDNHLIIEEAYLLRGRILEELGMYEPALYLYDEFLKKFPSSQLKDTVLGRLTRMGLRVAG